MQHQKVHHSRRQSVVPESARAASVTQPPMIHSHVTLISAVAPTTLADMVVVAVISVAAATSVVAAISAVAATSVQCRMAKAISAHRKAKVAISRVVATSVHRAAATRVAISVHSVPRDNQGYQQPQGEPQEGKAQENQQPQEGGYVQNYQPQGGYQPRGYQRPQQGGYGRPQGGYGRQQGGYGRPQQGGYGRPQQGGYGRPQQGGYGRPQQGGYGRPQQGGFGRPQKQKPNRKHQGYNPHRPVEYTEAIVDPNEELRLNKYLANAGVCSRREADEHIAAGLVKVNGEVVTELGTKVTRKDQVTFNDQPVSLERKVYVLLNKPKDTVTTSDDPQGRQTVMDLVRNASRERIYPVGRLDRNTTGVLLLTNDGDLASKLTHPKYIKKKIYHVWLDKDVAETDLARIAAGIELDDGPIHADAIAYANEEDKNQVGIEIHSGKNRIVRRIFEHLGYRVVKLDRVYFAGLTKKNLPRGRWRHLTQQEVSMLKMGAFE